MLEEDVRLDNQIQIGHNVVIGAHTAMAGCAAVAGSARIGRYCLIGGGAGIVGHIEICDQVIDHRDEPGHPLASANRASIPPARRCRTIAAGARMPPASSNSTSWRGASRLLQDKD